jgi:Ca2+-dependent lipid-binding protein
MVRIYVIDAFNLSSRDQGDDSDPYLIVSLGNKTYN